MVHIAQFSPGRKVLLARALFFKGQMEYTFGDDEGGLAQTRGRLRKDYPSLTGADLRLASYIAMGMENKHIARVMSIRPESVKQARWRLRGKLGLAPGESLDDLMRRLAARE